MEPWKDASVKATYFFSRMVVVLVVVLVVLAERSAINVSPVWAKAKTGRKRAVRRNGLNMVGMFMGIVQRCRHTLPKPLGARVELTRG